ncbi:O-antigen translocase [Vibrio vulnificus]|nr:O-antigen translocase [Vibrio vulnificus]EJE8668278.1 O-antigen translocase [Vibrio vulnificus]
MRLVKTSMLNAIAVSVKMLAMLIINKVLALYVGPAGYAVVGQFQNAIQIMLSVASGAFNAGIVKYTAEYNTPEDKERLIHIWRSAGSISIICTLVVAFVSYIGSSYWSGYFFNSPDYGNIFKVFALTIIFFVMNNLLISILNGKKEIKSYVAVNVSGSLISVILIFILVNFYGLYGVLLSLAIYQSVTFFVSLYICYQKSWFKFKYFLGKIDKTAFLKLKNYTVMALTSAICIPLCHMAIRQYLGNNLGWDSAGYWEAMWRISSIYLMFVTSTLSFYYLPRLSELKNSSLIKKEIFKGYKYILPCTAVLSSLVYFSKGIIVPLLFSEEFYPIKELFLWQLVGDSLKIGSWIVAYTVLAKSMTKFYIISEIFSSFCFYFLTTYFTNSMGLEGVAFAYAVNYLFYWVVVFLYVFYRLSVTGESNENTVTG